MSQRVLVVLLTLVTVLGGVTAPAFAGEDKGLCDENHSRGTIPGGFPLDVCFDGKTLHIRNSKDVPASLTIIGSDVKTPERLSRGATPAARALMFIRPSDFGKQPQINGPDFRSGTLPPKHLLKVPVGNGEVQVKVGKADTETMQYYVIAEALWKFMPGGEVSVEVMRVIAELIRELRDVGHQNVACHDRREGWGDLGCSALLGRNVTYAFGRAVVNGLAKGALKAILTLFDGALWVKTTHGDHGEIGGSTREFKLAAYKAPATQPTTKPPAGNPGGGNNGGGNGSNPGGGNPPPPGNTNPPPPPVFTATVQNKHLEGGSGLGEDSTPSYLSTAMQPRCASNGCKIGGTDMWSGATFTAHCWADGAFMTNENRNRPDDDANPHRIDTTKWMNGSINGHNGWISFIYLTPGSRNLGVKHC